MAETTTMPVAPTGVPATNYSAKTYDNNKYTVNGYEYPEDLMGKNSEYGGNYVIFYINVAEDSKMIQNMDEATKNANTVAISENERIKKNISGLELSAAKLTEIGAATGAGLTKIAGITGLTGLSGLKGMAAGGALAGNVALQTSNFTRAQKRLATAIALHVPNDLSIKYGAGWGEEETINLAGANEIVSAANNLVKGAFTGDQSVTIGNVKGVSGMVAATTMRAAPLGQAVGIATGLAPNPKKEQAFSGVDFRSFTFSYRFAPRSSSEAKNVLNIVNTFKYHMHPEYKDTKGFLFLYPSEFDIVYYHGSEENLKIHRHTSCVLTDLSINYAPNGVFNTFPDGMPTELSVQMTFKELTILTKELIQEGL